MLADLLTGSRPDLDALVAAFGTSVPALHRLKDTPQDPEWHAEGDVHIHTQLVLDELYREFETNGQDLTPEMKRELVLGVVFHDLAKPYTTMRREIHGVERVVAPRHEAKGRSAIATALANAGLPFESLWHVMAMVGSHHEPKLLVVKDRTPGEYRRISRRVDASRVAWLERADMRGRICPDQGAQLQHIEYFELGSEEYAPAGWQEEWRAHFADLLSDRTPAFQDRVFGEAVRAFEADKINTPTDGEFISFQEPEHPPELVVMCGPSGSGKSTFISRRLGDHEVVSLDNLREDMSGERSDQSLNGAVRQEAKVRLRAGLRPGKRVVWDATCLRKDFRGAVCETGFAYGALVTLVVFQSDLAGYASRNRSRDHQVPTRVLESQLDQWEWPEVDEAHRVLVLDAAHNVRGAFGFTGELPWGLAHARD